MPRIVNLSSSDHSSDEEDIHPKPVSLPLNERGCVHREGYFVGYNSFTQSNMYRYDENEIYCLTRIIDGQLRKFKKDTRTWLHKSSDKIKPSRKVEHMEHVNQINRQRINVPTNYSSLLAKQFKELAADEENTPSGICKPITENHKSAKEEQAIGVLEFYDDNENGNRNDKENINICETEATMGENITYMGDSDADLTYSEEDTPIKTRSFVGEKRQSENEPPSKSCSSVDVNMDVSTSVGSMHTESSFEYLDLCNESWNSNKNMTKGFDVPRKIAPAIEIENESFRENILDYAVNQQTRNPQGDEMLYCEEIYRKSRCRTGSRSAETPRGQGQASRARPGATPGTSPYNLRNSSKTKVMTREDNITIPKSSARLAGESTCKRLRFENQVDSGSKPSDQTKASRDTEAKPESEGLPSCSTEIKARSRVPSLFVITGYVLYCMLNSDIDWR